MMGRIRRFLYRENVLLVAFLIKMNILFRTKGNEKSFNPTYYISLVLAHVLSRIRGLEWDFYYMPYKDFCDRFRTFNGKKYWEWTWIEEAESTKQAREMYKNSPSYKWEDFIVKKSDIFSWYDVYIPLEIKNNL